MYPPSPAKKWSVGRSRSWLKWDQRAFESNGLKGGKNGKVCRDVRDPDFCSSCRHTNCAMTSFKQVPSREAHCSTAGNVTLFKPFFFFFVFFLSLEFFLERKKEVQFLNRKVEFDTMMNGLLLRLRDNVGSGRCRKVSYPFVNSAHNSILLCQFAM